MRTFVKASAPAAARTLEGAAYTSADVYERERRRIFSRSWVCAGRSTQIAAPGAFITMTVAGESLILTRDTDGAAHAFYNVCRHRGTRLCQDDAGTFKGSIQCPYHAWTYGLDGCLVAARNMDDVPGFDRGAYPLHEAALTERDGFIFVALDPHVPFDSLFEPLRERIAAWNPGSLRSARRIEYALACNWKLVFQNYSECYHCPVIHPQLEKLSPWDSGLNDFVEGPILGGYSTLRDETATLTASGRTARGQLPGVTGENRSRVYYYTVFPSLLLSLHPDYVMAHYVTPVDAAATRVVCEWLFDENAMHEPDFDASDAIAFWDETNRQDWRVNELTQLGVTSRAYTPGPYSQAEGLLHAFDRHYRSVMSE